MPKYLVGIDFGTLSARAMLVNAKTGEIPSQHGFDYPHGVMDERLPGGAPLPMDWALQHPNDYLQALKTCISGALEAANVSPADVIGLGIDFTSCTMVACDESGTPLCLLNLFKDNPHAYVKLWKHHAAQPQADRMTKLAKERGEPWLPLYGGKISSEGLFPKALQMLEEAPEVYAATAQYVEAGDWLTWRLTGSRARNACMAGYRALWDGAYPSKEYLRALNPAFENIVSEKLDAPVVPLGTRVGCISDEGAALCGLLPGTPVAAAVLDAHVAMAAAGITSPGKLLAIVGTSTCHLVLGDQKTAIPGHCGSVLDGMIPGFYGFEAGQSCVGDHFQWFIQNCLPAAYENEARQRGISPHALLRERLENQLPGENGLLALDWWNGNRSILVDGDLTGVILGLTLRTKPEDIYRALIEATAYGTRRIIENYEEHGVFIDEFHACGGIAKKDPFMMQIYADVCGLPIQIAETDQCGALGSAIFASVAAGKENGGYASVQQACAKLVKPPVHTYAPNPRNKAIYDRLYAQYKQLHDLFGRDEGSAVKKLKAIRQDVQQMK